MNCQRLHRFRRPVRLFPAAAAVAVAGMVGVSVTACGGAANPESLIGNGKSSPIPQPRSSQPGTGGAPSPPSRGGKPDGHGPHKSGGGSVDCSQAKCIALTFDDGPGPSTGQLLDTLKQENVPATFFVVGQQAQRYPDLVRREAAEGHEVGNHTWDHKDLSKLDPAGIRAEIDRSADAIQAAGAPRPTLLRPPYGAVNDQVRAVAGLPFIMWRVDPEDWKYHDSAKVAAAIVAGARPGRIVLSHDIQQTTVAAIPDVVGELRAQGYTFVTVSTLLNGVGLQNGASYFNRPPALDPPAPSTPAAPGTPSAPGSPSGPGTPDATDPEGTPGGAGDAPQGSQA